MGRQLVETLPAARALFDRANAVLGYDLAELCFQGPAEKLDSTVYSQPALFVASLAALESLRTTAPDVVANCATTAGLSLGEYTALTFAGVLEFEAGLRVVKCRGEAMQAASDAKPSGMVSILGLDREKIEGLCNEVRQAGEVLQIANFLCPGNIVVSGDKAACARVAEAAEKGGAMKTISLAVAGAFHTPLMQSAVDRLADALRDVPMSPPRIPVISNVDAQSHQDPEEIRKLLVQQVCSPVRWEDSMRALVGSGVDQFYEIGPGRVLAGLLKRIDRKIKCENISA
jgi:[acyl-carrier-protein] S-malonyltransferase